MNYHFSSLPILYSEFYIELCEAYLLVFLALGVEALQFFRTAGYRASPHAVGHTPLQSIHDTNDRSVTQSSLGLLNAVISCHAAELNLLSGQVGHSQAEDEEDPLEKCGYEQAKVLVDGPDLTGLGVVSQLSPCSAREVPEVHGRVVCDEESLAIHLFVVQWGDLALFFTVGGGEQSSCGKVMSMSDVCGFGEIEEIGVLAELELGLALVVWCKHGRKKGLVADAEDA